MNAIEESRGSTPRPVVPAGGQGVLFTDALPEYDTESGYRGPTACKAQSVAGATARQ